MLKTQYTFEKPCNGLIIYMCARAPCERKRAAPQQVTAVTRCGAA